MIAFELTDDGSARRCEYFGHARRRVVEQPKRVAPRAPIDKRQRRSWARRGTRGRRGARRIAPVEPLAMFPRCDFATDVAHLISDGRSLCVLYLPDGTAVTDAHLAALGEAHR